MTVGCFKKWVNGMKRNGIYVALGIACFSVICFYVRTQVAAGIKSVRRQTRRAKWTPVTGPVGCEDLVTLHESSLLSHRTCALSVLCVFLSFSGNSSHTPAPFWQVSTLALNNTNADTH
jgi:hypothetical protein